MLLKSRHHFANKGLYNQNYVFSSYHVRMWKLDHKEGWVSKKWCFQVVVLKKILGSPLDSKKLKPVNPKGNQAWIFIQRTDAKTPILWPFDAKRQLIGKDPDAVVEGKRMRWLDGNIDLMEMSLSRLWGIVNNRKVWCAAVHGVAKSRTWLSDWTTIVF